jgi:hypothetical protein
VTDTDITALVARLREVKTTDHERLCQGREYACSCGWDERVWAAAIAAADALEACQAENMDLRGLLAETVPDPEYRKMQDDEIERLRQERKAMLTRAEKAEAVQKT